MDLVGNHSKDLKHVQFGSGLGIDWTKEINEGYEAWSIIVLSAEKTSCLTSPDVLAAGFTEMDKAFHEAALSQRGAG